jgi:hypothetical protein
MSTVVHQNGRQIAVMRQRGRFVSAVPAIERFAKLVQFDAATGCVMWIGGKTHGRGHTADYGSFWFERRRWFAHRWAAKYIHGLEIEGMQVDHCCPHTGGRPNTLCVQHLQAVTHYEHVELETRRNMILTQVGVLEAEPLFEPDPCAPEIYSPPEWLERLRPDLASQFSEAA